MQIKEFIAAGLFYSVLERLNKLIETALVIPNFLLFPFPFH